MRKFLLAALLCSTLASMAETHYVPRISLGARAGATFSQMAFSPSIKQSWNPGTGAAVTFRYTEEKLFGFIAEVAWTQRGWAENYELLPFSYSRTIDYISVPFMTHIYFGAPRFKGFVNIGPEFDFYLADRIKANFDYENPGKVDGYPANRRTEQLYSPVTERFDYGIAGGVGIEYYLTPRNSIFLEGRFTFGLGNIFPATKADTFGASRNMSIQASVGYFFRLK